MSGAGSITAEPPPAAAPPPSRDGWWTRYGVALLFLLPALIFLGVWIIYPAIYTLFRSFFGQSGFDSFVGIDNYKTLFTSDLLLTAIKNNAIWVAVVPAFVTAVGLIFAVLTERVSWSVAFKTAVFMPMAISAFAAGVIWRVMYQQDPNLGAVNASIAVVKDSFSPAGVLSDAKPSSENLQGTPNGGITLQNPVQPGDVARLGLTGIPPDDVPEDAVQAVLPEAQQGGITGVVWRDFKPGGGNPNEVEQDELGLPGVTLTLLNSSGDVVDTTTSSEDGTFAFDGLEAGNYRVGISADTFAQPFDGVAWLGERLITPSLLIAYIWIWAGFSMVVIAAGLSAISRETLEAARTDGANEWQVFRLVTVPQLLPVLSVVFVTMLINVLKVFDIVVSLAPGSVQDDANVIALAMWRTSFGGANNFGLGSAIAVFLFILVIPILLLNVRNFRREA
ncbi:MAG TPA: ABC transporter permease subunit [Gaiellaceae bacterium]|nr:ABC transporter permease subunit [Gaiellaceae bacterium]